MISLLCSLVVVLPATIWLGVTLRRFIRDERQRTSLPPARAIAMASEVVVLTSDAYPQLNAFWGTEWIRIRHDGGAGWVSAKGENRLGLGDGPRPMAFDGETEVHLIGPEGCVATFKDPADALQGHRLLMDARDDVMMRPWDELAERLGLEGHYGLLEGVVDDRRVRVELFDHGCPSKSGSACPGPRAPASRAARRSPSRCRWATPCSTCSWARTARSSCPRS
ncbi:MAG: hypothetical protein GY913_05690 [Proteobacteria bacterium]|nr:hypothetical protein [Pseudomonadota bacterium]MCP4916396.1 hypothetical protein [Pseudomonadota bacterium]